MERINCKTCKFYYITWDPTNPNGCKKFGFKSFYLPSDIVYQSSGNFCQAYESKTK